MKVQNRTKRPLFAVNSIQHILVYIGSTFVYVFRANVIEIVISYLYKVGTKDVYKCGINVFEKDMRFEIS